MIDESHTGLSRIEDWDITKGTEARNSSAWQEPKNHLMLFKYEVQSSKWQRNVGEVDKVKAVKAFPPL